MKWFINLKTRTKLIFGFGLIISMLAVIVGTAYVSILQLQERSLLAQSLLTLENNLNEQRVLILTMLEVSDRTTLESLSQQVKDLGEQGTELIKQCRALSANDPGFTSQLDEISTIWTAFWQTREEKLIPLILEGKVQDARSLAVGVQRDRYIKMRDLDRRLNDESRIQAAQTAKHAVRIFWLLGLSSLAASLIIVVFLSRIIANPLNEISAVARKVAAGDLAVQVHVNGRIDEVGVLSQTFSQMTTALQQMAMVAKQLSTNDLRVTINPQSKDDILGNAFATMVENMRRTAAELSEGVNVLATSASEILTTTAELASSAMETGTAIAETTATVEQVKQTAQVSSQKAKYVSESANKTTQVAQTGKKSVETSIEGMQHIQAQMESIAESIVRLSEQSQAIGEIIATVNDLAEQSNLLAVNAAIEAAKAGEQGKGFAVVAQEVKSLAEQSKQATSQVRAILNEIQKATTAAVMATEQGGKAVETGVKQSAEAGEAIRVLSDNITQSAQAATQIAATSQQQLVGTDQVALAMENIKQASTQNVAGTKQAELAAHNLHALGQKLKHLVAQYKM